MSYTLHFDPDKRTMYALVTGRDTAEDTQQRIREILVHPEWRAGMDIVADLSGVTDYAVTPAEMGDVTTLRERLDAQFGGGRLAIVAPDDLVYGTCRVFESVSERRFRLDVRVCRTLAEAEAWLASPRVDPMDLATGK